MTHHKYIRQLARAYVALQNARSPDVALLLKRVGYDEATLAEGDRLHATADLLVQDAETAARSKHTLSTRIAEAREEAEATYADMLTLARMALSDDDEAEQVLEFTGARATAHEAQHVQWTRFYDALLANPAWIKRMKRFNQTRATIRAAYATAQRVKALRMERERLIGERKRLVAERDAAMAALTAWMVDFRDVALVAFRRAPYQATKLGFKPKGRKRGRKQQTKETPQPGSDAVTSP